MVCSTFRFISIIEHKATTYPTFDPTWYGGTGVVLSILEVDIATIMASLPVFWPFLRRNIDRILITHEIEVKVTEQHFTQIDDAAGAAGAFHNQAGGGRSSRDKNGSRNGGGSAAMAAASAVSYTPWMDDNDGDDDNNGPGKNKKCTCPVGAARAGLKLDHKSHSAGPGVVVNVMMRDLGRTGSGASASEAGEADRPFDGRSPGRLGLGGVEPRSPARPHFLNRDSKEGLLDR